MSVESTWNVQDRVKPPAEVPADWGNNGRRVFKLPAESYDAALSQPYLVNVGGIKLPNCALCGLAGALTFCVNDQANLCAKCDASIHNANSVVGKHERRNVEELSWYIKGALLYLEAFAEDVKGTGKGGAFHSAGGIVIALIPELFAAANHFEFDIALVTIRRSTFAAIQLERNRFALERQLWQQSLPSPALRDEANRLARLAREGQLVLFLGAGVSAGAGLPTWKQLLEQLARAAHMPEEEMALLDKMNFLDSARVIEMRLGGWKNLARAIAERVQVQQYSLLCGLLSSLPVHEVVTTNYNQMFELTSRGVGLNVSILPYHPIENCDRWILKMHGCVTHPEDIVLTREHYMRYQSTRSALSGIVQSLLITRHMLFTGFSLQDDNFHRIADEVRRSLRTVIDGESTHDGHELPATPNLVPILSDEEEVSFRLNSAQNTPQQTPPSNSASTQPALASSESQSRNNSMKFGTQLYLVSEPVTELLWKQDLNLVSMEKAPGSSLVHAARRLEVFMDYVLSLATTTTAFLLNPQYDGLLDDNQRALRDSLEHWLSSLSTEAKEAPEWAFVEHLMSELGYKRSGAESTGSSRGHLAENHGFCKSRG